MADALRNILGGQQPEHNSAPSMAHFLPVVLTLLPVVGILLALAGLILAGTVIGLLVVTPLLIFFSPVLVPAAVAIGFAVTGFLTAGALGIAGLSSLSWVFKYVRGARERVPEDMEQLKRRMGEMAGKVGQRTKDVGQGIQNKAHEHTGRSTP